MSWNVILDILKLGLSGLVFMFAYLGYRLLATEQTRERPNKESYRNIRIFNIVTLCSAVIVGVFSLLTMVLRHDADNVECQNRLSRLTTAANNSGASADDLRINVRAFSDQCGRVFEGAK